MVQQWVKDMVEGLDKNLNKITEPKVGEVVLFKPFHDGDNYKIGDEYKVEIIRGQYWGQNGLSNFWYWYRLNDNMDRVSNEHGYGNFYKLS